MTPRFHEESAFGLIEWILRLYVDYENQIFLLDTHTHTHFIIVKDSFL